VSESESKGRVVSNIFPHKDISTLSYRSASDRDENAVSRRFVGGSLDPEDPEEEERRIFL